MAFPFITSQPNSPPLHPSQTFPFPYPPCLLPRLPSSPPSSPPPSAAFPLTPSPVLLLLLYAPPHTTAQVQNLLVMIHRMMVCFNYPFVTSLSFYFANFDTRWRFFNATTQLVIIIHKRERKTKKGVLRRDVWIQRTAKQNDGPDCSQELARRMHFVYPFPPSSLFPSSYPLFYCLAG